MKKRSITSNYLYNLTYQLIILLIPLISIPYLTRVLGATELGIYSYTYSIATIFFLFAALGINTYGQREIAYVQQDKEKRSKIFWELVIIRFFATVFSLIILYIFSFLTSRYSLYYQIFGLYVFGNLFDITWFYQGIEDFKAVAIRNIIVNPNAMPTSRINPITISFVSICIPDCPILKYIVHTSYLSIFSLLVKIF